MSAPLTNVPVSPSREGNFILAYDKGLAEQVQREGLLEFIKTNNDVNTLCDADSSFFPRAFTDPDLIDKSHEEASSRISKHSPSEVKMSQSFEGRVSGSNYQPDVIVSNCHQRSGPDGSPALAPSASRAQGSVALSNLSGTSELFAPVRTLTFSDVDQNSHIDDSYVNSSRLVSTPTRRGSQSHSVGYGPGMAASDTDSDSDSNPVSSQFRELEGQAENDNLMDTGNFQPSAFGLNQEFMDQFTGRTKNPMMNYEENIFSPLSNGDRHIPEDQRSEGRTPPLHSPAPNSPYAKYCVKKSPRRFDNYSTQPDTQFEMSPSRNVSGCFEPSSAALDELHMTGANFQQPVTTDRQEYMSSDRFYPNHYTFEPIDKQPANLSQRSIPRNLNEYNCPAAKVQQQDQTVKGGGDNFLQTGSRVTEKAEPETQFDTQFAVISPSTFEQRYLQKMQVSVKVPAVSYDSGAQDLTHESVQGCDKRFDPPGLPPDSLDDHYDSEDDRQLADDRETKSQENSDLIHTQQRVSNQSQYLLNGDCEDDSLKQVTHSQGQFDADFSRGLKNMDSVRSEERGSEHSCHNIEFLSAAAAEPNNGQSNTIKDGSLSHSLPESICPEQRISERTLSQSQHQQSHQGKSSNGSQSQSVHGSQTSHSSVVACSTSTSVVNRSAASANESATSAAPSSRLMQETVSQKMKTNQKYQSNVPAPSKAGPVQQGKVFKKPVDVTKTNTISVSAVNSIGARKTILNECDRSSAKSKGAEKNKSKPVLSEMPHYQKSKTVNTSNRPWNYNNKNDNTAVSQSQLPGQQCPVSRTEGPSQFVAGQGQNPKGQGHRDSVKVGSNSGSPHGLDRSTGERRVVTQVESTSPVPIETQGNNMSAKELDDGDVSLDVRGMEEVRHQIRNMLRGSHNAPSQQDRSQYESSEILAGYGVELGDLHRPPDMPWNFRRGPEDGECLVENFPSFSSQFMSDSGNVSRSDMSLSMENQRLRDMLEKERYRRKHCEQYIQQLNVKLLETQQQVAVAVATDKRKDIMIEQLDKQLAKVVDGWKRKDQEKDEVMESLRREKEEIQENMNQQQQMIGQFEHDMSDAVEALRREKEQSTHNIDELRHKIVEKEGEVKHVQELCAAEKDKAELMTQECESLREARDSLDKKLDTMQRRLHREQDEWFQREQELLQRIEEVSEKNIKILQLEKSKSEEQAKLAEEIMDQYQEASTQVKKLEMDLDAAIREKESMKIEMGIMEAKFDNAHRVLEADLHATMERQISAQIADVMKRNEKSEADLQEKHRQVIIELNQRHGQEMEKQLAMFREDVQRKENEHRRQLQEMEESLTTFRNENSELKLAKQKLESTRLEILTKLQYAMQSQWNEALSMLAGTPHRRTNTEVITDDNTSAGLQEVSFSLPSPLKAVQGGTAPVSTNQQLSYQEMQPELAPVLTLPTTSESQVLPTSTNQTPPRDSTNQKPASTMSPGEVEPVSHTSQEEPADVSVEMTALSHFKNFQEYMNSLTKTPEWIATINSRAERSEDPQRPSPAVPSPTDVAAILSSHLHNVQTQHMNVQPYFQTIQSNASILHPPSIPANQIPGNTEQKSSHVISPLASSDGPSTTASTLPLSVHQGSHQVELSMSGLSVVEEDKNTSIGDLSAIGSDPGSSVLWSGAPGMSHAVQIRPPQQGDDHYYTEDEQSLLFHITNPSMSSYSQRGHSFSPPTKQDKPQPQQSFTDINQENLRLNSEYAELSDKIEQHENRQNDLQHYIQLLLHKSPGNVQPGENNESLTSHEELDLDDTAQAAQLQAELDRIQVLRQKQEAASKLLAGSTDRGSEAARGTPGEGNSEQAPGSKILSADQLAEVTRLLNQVKGQGDSGDPVSPQVTELLELLKHAQGSSTRQGTTKGPGMKHSPRQGSTVGPDKNRGLIGFRKGTPAHMGQKVPEKTKQPAEGHKPDKPSTKGTVASVNKKIERKIAGAPPKGDKSSKLTAWK